MTRSLLHDVALCEKSCPTGGWLVVDGGPVATWTWPGALDGPGVLLLPPIGYESSSSHRLQVSLAAALAARGSTVMTFDYPGLGDSAGDAPTLGAWEAAVEAVATQLRDGGAASLALLGIGWGGSLALSAADALGARAVAALSPALDGRRYVRQLTLLGSPFPDGSGGLSVGGYALPSKLLAELAAVDVAIPVDCPALIVSSSATPPPATAQVLVSEGLAAVLERPAEEAEVDPELVAAVVEWLAPTPGQPGPVPVQLPTIAEVDGVQESFVQLGPYRLPGVLTEPLGRPATQLLILLNSGSDPHTGPGRSWVELARGVARDDSWAALRVDARGWGKAVPGPTGDARPYDAHLREDLRDLLADLRGRGWATIVVAGLCSGAWIALEAARTDDLDGVIALNPQLYWQPGDPIEARMADSVARRTEEIAFLHAEALGGRWDSEDAAGLRNPAGRLLDDLAQCGRPIELVFSGDDPGLMYLLDRVPRRLDAAHPVVRVRRIEGIDHGFQQVWDRPVLRAALSDVLRRWSAAPAQ